MTHHHPRLTHPKPLPLSNPLPYLRSTPHCNQGSIYSIIHYLFYIIFITNSFTDCTPKAQSNRRTAVGWSSSKAATHVIYYVRTFRHGSQIGAHHPDAAGWSTWATGHRRRSVGPVPSKNSPPYQGPGSRDPGPRISSYRMEPCKLWSSETRFALHQAQNKFCYSGESIARRGISGSRGRTGSGG
jgi:hypothetical protein